jgi:hypothetical protein
VDKKANASPDHFDSYEEAAEFWDSHDTTDYIDEFRTVEFTSEFHGRSFEVQIPEDVARALEAKARQEGVSIERLASDLLRAQLKTAA